LTLALWLSPAEAACIGSELTATARGGVGALSVSWQVNPPCDVAETGLMLGRQLRALSPVAAPIRRDAAVYSSTLPVNEIGVYWVAAYVVDAEGNMIMSEPDVADVFLLDSAPSIRASR
jgi:hypothetical protein